MRLVGLIAAVVTSLCSVNSVPVVFGQANDLKPAMVRIRDLNNQGGGSGFVFRYDDKEHLVYVLTNEHVVHGADRVNVQFFSGDAAKSVVGTVIRQDRGKDLAVVKVSGESNIPPDVMMIVLARIIHIFEDNKSLLCYKHVD
jgi:S1-C subfamily serine protease